MQYPTVEHAYQAQKTLNKTIRLAVARIGSAGAAKKFGRLIDLRPDWELVKVPIMRELIRLKFPVGGCLSEELLATYPCVLVEGNTWGDIFWGICEGRGTNHLGRLLMERRAQLMEKQ